MPADLVDFYLNYAKPVVIEGGYGNEIEWCQTRFFDRIIPEEFLIQYRFAVFSSSGLNNKIVEGLERKFNQANSDGTNAFETIKNKRMRQAIMEMQVRYRQVFEILKNIPTDTGKIEYLGSLRQIGKKEKYHLARNLGIDCVKPDIHMERLAKYFGFATPLEMCQEIQKTTNERIGVIDVVLWRLCNITGCSRWLCKEEKQ